jgi:hypothetical protein
MVRRVPQMSDYKEHVYDESFNDSILSFDQYVQESVGLIIAGIAAFIALLIILIKKIFFSKNTVQGASDSVYNAYLKIDILLNSSNVPRRIHVVKGYSLDKSPAGELREVIRIYNDNLQRIIDHPNISPFGEGGFNIQEQKKSISAEIESAKQTFVERTYDTGELRGYVKNVLRQFKDAASELKRLEQIQKSLKNSQVSDTDKNTLNEIYKLFVNLFQTEKNLTNEWYKNIKNGIKEAAT